MHIFYIIQTWTIQSSTNVNPPTPATGPGTQGRYTGQRGFLSYYEICLNVKNGGWSVVHFSSGQMSPYAYSNVNWVGYDDPAFAIVKTNYIVSKGLGGAMAWDISYDDFHNFCEGGFNPILTAISKTILLVNIGFYTNFFEILKLIVFNI